ncbi:MAG: PEGA domain-containing protein, partial [Deltaproteobacteria bacterium]|nr:PEGA domain-containing protein [Deltaproteobacteria bacterium]
MKVTLFLACCLSGLGSPTLAADDDILLLPPLALANASGHAADSTALGQLERHLEQARGAAGIGALAWEQPSDTVRPTPGGLPDELAELQKRADASLRQVEYRNAVKLQRKLVDTLERQLEQIGDVEPVIAAHLALANLYLGVNEQMLARNSLDRVARLRPGLEIDLRRYPPAVAEALADAKLRVQAEPRCEIQLVTTPPGAIVYIDGIPQGQTPTTAQVGQGLHLVWLGAAGHAPVQRALQLSPGGRLRVEEQLLELPAHALQRQLRQELETSGRRVEAISLASALAGEKKARGLILSALVPVVGGWAIVLARSHDRGGAFVISVDAAFDDAAAPLKRALQDLAFSPNLPEAQQLRASQAPDALALLHPRFEKLMFGVPPGGVRS